MSIKVKSAVAWDKFEESEIWLDIKEVLNKRLESVRDGLEQEKDFDNLCRLQGASDQLRFLITLPEMMRNLNEE